MTRDDLKDYKYKQEWIKGRFEYIEEYKTSIINITSILSDIPKGSRQVQDDMAEKVAILLDNVNELMAKIIKVQDKQKEVLEQLDKVDQPYRLILEKEYIQGKTLVTVASEMGYSYRDMCRKKRIALNKFEEI